MRYYVKLLIHLMWCTLMRQYFLCLCMSLFYFMTICPLTCHDIYMHITIISHSFDHVYDKMVIYVCFFVAHVIIFYVMIIILHFCHMNTHNICFTRDTSHDDITHHDHDYFNFCEDITDTLVSPCTLHDDITSLIENLLWECYNGSIDKFLYMKYLFFVNYENI